MRAEFLIKIVQSFCIIFILPYCVMKFIPSFLGFFVSIILLMVIFPLYFIYSTFAKFQSKMCWFLPLINGVIFALTVKIFFNDSAYVYLWVYLLLAYMSIFIKYVYAKHGR